MQVPSGIVDSNARPEDGAPEADQLPDLSNSTGLRKTSPSFHLLIPASDPNTDLCKTLLSAFILGYPAPTLLNWGKRYGDLEEDRIASHTAKIRGVYDFLSDERQVKDDDLVLIIDGYDVWFQLPPQIMLSRYHEMIAEANNFLRNRYGLISTEDSHAAKFTQKVIFGADKLCWPNPKDDPACAAIPYSTLPKDAYGADTDRDPEGFNRRPRFLNSGNIIGPVKDVRNIYRYATFKTEFMERGAIGDQLVFAEIFGEQEYQRETQRIAAQGTASRWMDWLSNTLGTQESPLSANVTINNMTVKPGQRYEYSIGLDYESRLFQTMTHSASDIEFLNYSQPSAITTILKAHPYLHNHPLFLPSDLQAAENPLTYASPGDHSAERDARKKSLLLPYSPNLDTLPANSLDVAQPSWLNIPLATNINSATIPTLLHINGDKSLLDSWWPRLWYHPYLRALLRRFIRSTQTLTAADAAAKGGLDWWDTRGGRGGVWTANGDWMSWSDVCLAGTEGEVFRDGKGVFGKEEGDGRVVNSFGKVISGDE